MAGRPPKPKFQERFKEDIEIQNMKFKLLPADVKRMEGWSTQDPKIRNVEHTHMFSTMNDRNGQPNLHCAPACGHTHEITIDKTQVEEVEVKLANGEIKKQQQYKVVVGPPIKIQKKSIGGVYRQVKTPVTIPRHEALGGPVTDTHTHQSWYLHSEVITQGDRDKAREENQRMAKGMLKHDESLQANVERAHELETNAEKAEGVEGA